MGKKLWRRSFERWVTAVRLLDVTTIGQLVIRGDPNWCSVLFLTSLVVKAVVEFGVRAISSPSTGLVDKVIQMLKDKLKEDAKDSDVAKRKDTEASKKCKRENGAY